MRDAQEHARSAVRWAVVSIVLAVISLIASTGLWLGWWK